MPPSLPMRTKAAVALVSLCLGLAGFGLVAPSSDADHRPHQRPPAGHHKHEHPSASCGHSEKPGSATCGSRNAHGGWIEKHRERLGFDEATSAAVAKVVAAAKAEAERLERKLDLEHAALRVLLDEDVPVEAQVMKQVEKVSAVELEMSKSRLRSMIQIRSLLKPDQIRELQKIREEYRSRTQPEK